MQEKIKANEEAFRQAFVKALTEGLFRADEISKRAMRLDQIAHSAGGKTPSNAKALAEYQAHNAAVVESIVASKKARDAVAELTSDAIKNKWSAEELKAAVLEKIGAGNKPHHVAAVVETNVATARSASTIAHMEKNKDLYPAWQFLAVLDDRTTPNCQYLHGKLFKRDDRRYFPPIHWRCRSEGIPVDVLEFEEEGGEFDKNVHVTLDEGFRSGGLRNFDAFLKKAAQENPGVKSKIKPLKTFEKKYALAAAKKKSVSIKWDPDEAQKKALAALTRAQKTALAKAGKSAVGALKTYKGSSYAAINGYLRGNRNYDDDWMLKEIQGLVKGMEKAFEAAPKLPSPITVFRGFAPGKTFKRIQAGMKKGPMRLKDAGYMSTTIDDDTAMQFGRGGGVFMKIFVPKGTRAIALDEILMWGASEEEILLNAGTELVLTSMNWDAKLRRWVIDAYVKEGK